MLRIWGRGLVQVKPTAAVTARGAGASQNGKMAETTLNLRGLKCPLPALRTRKALSRLPTDDIVIVECTDPLSEIDIPNLLRETGDRLENAAREDGVFVFRIRKR
jgi:tRNA 2-thiouridine synthesizing protein A